MHFLNQPVAGSATPRNRDFALLPATCRGRSHGVPEVTRCAGAGSLLRAPQLEEHDVGVPLSDCGDNRLSVRGPGDAVEFALERFVGPEPAEAIRGQPIERRDQT